MAKSKAKKEGVKTPLVISESEAGKLPGNTVVQPTGGGHPNPGALEGNKVRHQ